MNKAVPIIVAGGGGGLGVGRYLDENVQQAKGIVFDRYETTGQIENDNFEELKSAGPGGELLDILLYILFQKIFKFSGGWRSKQDSALDPRSGASLLEGARGGIACTERGAGGFGGGKKKLFFPTLNFGI